MPRAFSIPAPSDYLLARDVCSYGYFLLAPNRWDHRAHTFTRPLDLDAGIATLTLAQPSGAGTPLSATSDRTLTRPEQRLATSLLSRMLNLADPGVAEFHRLDKRWARSGRARLFRSPTFFEDVVKTVTSCNVTWPSTVSMNRRLCEVINPAFPTPAQLARRRPATLRARCGVGYRDARLVALARLFAKGEIDPAWFENPATTDDAVFDALLELPGIGPYAAGNIMQLLGRYSRLAIDTESVRHGRTVLGFSGSAREVERAVERHYQPFGAHRFRSYWFEVWAYYEQKKGPAWTWDRETTGRQFTAALLEPAKTAPRSAEAPRRQRRAPGPSVAPAPARTRGA